MANYHEAPELPVIGTSRKPNSTDLHNRGLNGLPEPSPTIKLRKAALKKEQLALRMQLDSSIPVNYLRTRIGESSDESELSSLSSCSDTDSNITSDETTVSESTVARDEEVVGFEKSGWNMRSRTAVQMHPYKREREVYKEMFKGCRSRKDE
ncbi:hypothetical protein BDR22DRAFT_824030 [Usnea florida]